MNSTHHLTKHSTSAGLRRFLVVFCYLLSPDDSSCRRLDGRFVALKPGTRKILRGAKAVIWLIIALFVTWLVQIGN